MQSSLLLTLQEQLAGAASVEAWEEKSGGVRHEVAVQGFWEQSVRSILEAAGVPARCVAVRTNKSQRQKQPNNHAVRKGKAKGGGGGGGGGRRK